MLALLLFVLVRSKPRDMGLQPYGEGLQDPGKKRSVTWDGFSMETLKKLPSFYLLCACAFFSCVCVLATQYNIVPYFQDCGMSVTRTGKLYGVMMLALSIFKLLLGILCDAIGAKRVLVISHCACAGGLALVMLLPQTDTAMIVALIVYDLAIPLTTMLFPLVSVEMFGIRAQGMYIGTVMAMIPGGNIISEPLANAVYDSCGSYEPVFWGCAIMALAMIPVYAVLFATTKRSRETMEA